MGINIRILENRMTIKAGILCIDHYIVYIKIN